MAIFDPDDFLFYWTPGAGYRAPVGGGLTFTRTSTASRRNRLGQLEELPAGYPRRNWVKEEDLWQPAVRLEASRTNELFNSDAPATQTRSLTAGTYTLWIEGSGSVDASGATDGAYGTATESTTVENDLTFTVSATQDVTFTVTGTVTRFQCEEGGFRSSYISTAGSAVTRSADSLSFDISGTPLATPQEMTVYCKFVERGTSLVTSNRILEIGGPVTGSAPRLFLIGLGSAGVGYRLGYDDSTTVVEADSGVQTSLGDVVELRATLQSDGSIEIGQTINGGAEVTDTASGASMVSAWSENTLSVGKEPGSNVRTGLVDFLALTIAPGVKTMDEMRSLAGVR